MTPSLTDLNDSDPLNGDKTDGLDGPLFYSLSQSAQDDLVAHFLAQMTGEGTIEAYPELLAA